MFVYSSTVARPEVKGVCSNLQTLSMLRKNLRQAKFARADASLLNFVACHAPSYPSNQFVTIGLVVPQIMLSSPLCDGPGFVRDKYEPGTQMQLVQRAPEGKSIGQVPVEEHWSGQFYGRSGLPIAMAVFLRSRSGTTGLSQYFAEITCPSGVLQL